MMGRLIKSMLSLWVVVIGMMPMVYASPVKIKVKLTHDADDVTCYNPVEHTIYINMESVYARTTRSTINFMARWHGYSNYKIKTDAQMFRFILYHELYHVLDHLARPELYEHHIIEKDYDGILGRVEYRLVIPEFDADEYAFNRLHGINHVPNKYKVNLTKRKK